MSANKKKVLAWIGLAVITEAIIITDGLAYWIAQQFTTDIAITTIIAFPLTYLFWIGGILAVRSLYKKRPEVQFRHKEVPTVKNILFGLLCMSISTAIIYISWDGLKIYREFTGSMRELGVSLGSAYLAALYFYYLLEAVLITMVIAFAQEAGEALLRPRWIPYGGIALAVLWGLPHIAFHGIADGAITIARAPLFGLAYLAMRKNPKYAFPLILLMFLL